jgi:hypothetical protein
MDPQDDRNMDHDVFPNWQTGWERVSGWERAANAVLVGKRVQIHSEKRIKPRGP